MPSAPAAGVNGVAHEDDAAAVLSEPLLANDNANGGDGGFHLAGTLATVVVTTALDGNAKAKGSVAAEAKDPYWVEVHRQPDAAAAATADLESGGDGGRPLMFREKKVTAAILYPYRALIFIRIIAIILFIGWRIKHNNSDVMWFWATSIVADVWFTFSWLLYQLPKLNPIKRSPDLAVLRQHYDLPDGGSKLPGIDVFVTTADPVDEPVLYTMNCVLSILAVDYPIDRSACYLSDDSGTLIMYEALAETADFAALWVPFCRKHSIEPRAPENYFQREGMIYAGRSPGEFMNDYKHVHLEYQKFKQRLETLDSTIRERSDVYNAIKATEAGAKATWMADGTEWPGTWVEPAENHKKGHHAGVVQVVREHPSGSKAQPALEMNPLNFDGVDGHLPMLVYMARAKSPCHDHNKKAGNLNAQLRVSAMLSNAPFVINFDCDHYINDSQALRAAMCFMLDPKEGDDMAFVQFPQRFENVDPTDRYGNHNRVFFNGAMYALNGLQGPSYLGTGCIFRRLALYGVDPPRWRPDEVPIDSSKFGNSIPFLSSVSAALNQERHATATPPDLDDDSFLAEMTMLVSASFDIGTDWGRGVGYIYEIATEDMVTGFRIHGQGWRSTYCTMEVDAFRGTAPINLTERLYQIVRWAGGSVEMFFSHNNPLLAGPRLHPMQRTVYLNYNIYPVTSLFLLLYGLCPAMWLIPEEILIQRPFTRYVVFLVFTIALIHAIGLLEIRWAGNVWLDWWRGEQFFMVASLSAYPTALLHMLVKLLTRGKGIRFRVTSKQAMLEDDDGDKYAEMYEVRWVPIMVPAAVVLCSNTMAIGVAMGKAVVYGRVWPAEQRIHAALGLVFNIWIMVLLQPFALAVIGRWSKRPNILFVLFPMAFVAFALVYISLHFFVVTFFPSMEI